MKFTEEQQAFIASTEPMIALEAVPGSGKTEAVVARIKRILEASDTASVICITFTVAAASEIRERLKSIIGSKSDRHYIGTLHSYALAMVEKHRQTLGFRWGFPIQVVGMEESFDRLKRIAVECRVKATNKELAMWHGSSNGGVKAGLAAKVHFGRMLKENKVDFPILQNLLLRLVREGKVSATHLIVDEYQDSSAMDLEVYQSLDAPNKAMIYDPCQAIYDWRGADSERALEWVRSSEDFRRYSLTTNFRSTDDIVEASNQIAARIGGVMAQARPDAPAGEFPVHFLHYGYQETVERAVEVTEIEFKAGQTVAVLCRYGKDAKRLQEAAGARGMATKAQDVDKEFLRLVRQAWAVWQGTDDKDTLEEFMIRLIGRDGYDRRILDHAFDHLSLWEEMKKEMLISGKDAWTMARHLPQQAHGLFVELALGRRSPAELDEEVVGKELHIGTVHSAKGREWDTVIVMFTDSDIWDPQDPEIVRLFYVAATRAKKRLLFFTSQTRINHKGEIVADLKPSEIIPSK